MKPIKFKFIEIDKLSHELDQVKNIYNDSFPERDRAFSFDQFVNLSASTGLIKINAIYADGSIIGMMITIERVEYMYLWYYAIKQDCRNQGLGKHIIKDLQDRINKKALICRIETPIVGTSNYNQRVQRQNFYESVGMVVTNYSLGVDDENMNSLVTNKKNGKAVEYYSDFVDLLWNTIKRPKTQGMRFYIEANGNKKEVSEAEWFKANELNM